MKIIISGFSVFIFYIFCLNNKGSWVVNSIFFHKSGSVGNSFISFSVQIIGIRCFCDGKDLFILGNNYINFFWSVLFKRWCKAGNFLFRDPGNVTSIFSNFINLSIFLRDLKIKFYQYLRILLKSFSKNSNHLSSSQRSLSRQDIKNSVRRTCYRIYI